jgi:hypothetical protein
MTTPAQKRPARPQQSPTNKTYDRVPYPLRGTNIILPADVAFGNLEWREPVSKEGSR